MKNTTFFVLLFLLAFACEYCHAADSNTSDFIGKLSYKEYKGVKYHYYIPESAKSKRKTPLKLLVLVHGRGLNPDVYAKRWFDVAEERGVALVAPLFDKKTFPNYNRLNIKKTRADLKLLQIIEDLNVLWPVNTQKFFIYGHSAGAQFAHRFAMVHPNRIIKGVASCAGNYTFPDPAVKYHYGIGQIPGTNDIEFNVDAFVQLHFAVIVGELDIDPNEAGGTEAQGKNRIERAWNFYNAMKEYAKNKEIPFNLQFAKISKVGHSSKGTTPWAKKYLFNYGAGIRKRKRN